MLETFGIKDDFFVWKTGDIFDYIISRNFAFATACVIFFAPSL